MSTADVIDFRNLVNELREATPGWGGDVLLPWLEQRPEVLAGLREHGRPGSHAQRIPWEDTVVLPGLYALSRLVDILISPHQPVDDSPALLSWTTDKPWWSGPVPDKDAWPLFARVIGATPIAQDAFHPFFHEIVQVEPADDPDEPPRVVAEHWTGQLLDTLLLVRSGVTVRAGASHLDPTVAATSCLYWSWWRRNRVVRDLSHGWGSSSQWDTDFRRDFVVDGELHYNVDASYQRRPRKPDVRHNVPEGDDRDLLRYRHGLLEDRGTHQHPYDFWLVERG